jgi:transcription elongation factor Elf1
MTRNMRRAAMWKTIQDYKKYLGCQNCGYDKSSHALQFDHLEDKKANVSDLVRSDYGADAIWAEIEKCQVLCANCHAEVTQKRKHNSQG